MHLKAISPTCRRRTFVTALATITASLLLSACGGGGDTTPTTPSTTPTTSASGAASTKLSLAFVVNNASDFWTIARAGCEKAAAETGDDVQFKIPEDGAAATQKRIVDDLLAKGINGIAISPVDPANMTLMLNDVAKQTLLFTHDSDAPQSDRVCYVGTDNVAAGRQAGDLIKAALPNGGKVMMFVGTLDAQNAHDRAEGIKESLKDSKIEIIDTRTDDTDRVRAKSNAIDTMTKYPDVACLVGLWSYNGPAIYNAVKESGKVGQVKIVCFDEEAETLAGVKDGVISATVVQQPYEFGHMAITMMDKYLKGDKSVVPAAKKVIIPTRAITKENVDDFASQLKLLRGH